MRAGSMPRPVPLLHCSPAHVAIPQKAQGFSLVARARIKRQCCPQSEAAATREILGPAFLYTGWQAKPRRALEDCRLQPLTQKNKAAITSITNGHFRSQKH